MKTNTIIFFLIILLNPLFALSSIYTEYTENEIYLSPIKNTMLYDNFTDTLYPFFYSKLFKLDNKTSLKLINEIEYSNGLFGDILKVEVLDGYHKGKIGYILEEKVHINLISIKKGAQVFFKHDTYIYNNRLLIEKETKCSIEESRIESGKEVLTLRFSSSTLKNLSIEYHNKNHIHFIINKSSEIAYYQRKGMSIVKIVDPNTLLPVEKASYNNSFSGSYGILYIDKKENFPLYIIKKKGYTDGIIIPFNKKENAFLCFMENLDYIKYYDDRESIYEKRFYQFIIDSKNKSISNKVGVKILSIQNFAIFGYPLITQKNFEIKGGFYIKNASIIPETKCKLAINDKNLLLMHFDTKLVKWQMIPILQKDNSYIIKNLQDGYYLLVCQKKLQYIPIEIKTPNKITTSRIFFRDKNGKISFQTNLSSLKKRPLLSDNNTLIPEGRYETLFFDPGMPSNLFQKIVYINSPKYTYENKNFFEDKTHENAPKGLPPIYNGLWYRKGIKKNNNLVKEKNILEYLGDMNFVSPNKISFNTNTYKMEGYIEIIDKKRLYIHLTGISEIIENYDDTQKYLVTPSLFNSQLIIPAFYSFYVGIFQISYDSVYFKRKKIYNDIYSKKPLIKMTSMAYGNPVFPVSEKETKYKIYFSQ